ncbi:MAG: SDR family NAD(P)-dependent oxidoreductase [Segniliparus sp.]|uniref:SDR family NAD(P)-dependent oxidoreductase n=1 Tax=Segniliparus sp. TaxID=2804064 RepID=UPI003F3F1FC2
MPSEPRPSVAVVTGASGGIGQGIVRAFLDEGASVVGIDAVPGKDFGGRYRHLALDVTDARRVAEAVAEAVDSSEATYTLVNAVGVREIVPTRELPVAEFEHVLRINTTSLFVASQAFCEAVIARSAAHASIVNIASVSGFLAEPNRTAYTTSKHAVIGLTKQFALEYAKHGIRANAVAPGVIRTPLTEAYFHDEEQLARVLRGQLLDRVGAPEDVGHAVAFLADERSAFITGAILVVDGGWTVGKDL